jgi:hypothetical protein
MEPDYFVPDFQDTDVRLLNPFLSRSGRTDPSDWVDFKICMLMLSTCCLWLLLDLVRAEGSDAGGRSLFINDYFDVDVGLGGLNDDL